MVAREQPCLVVGISTWSPPRSLAWQKGSRLDSRLTLKLLGLLLPVGSLGVLVSAHGENNCNGHLLEFKNSLLAAESGYSLHCLNSPNSLICHQSMHAPSLASVMCVESVGVVGVGRGSVMVILGLHVGRALHVWMGRCTM